LEHQAAALQDLREHVYATSPFYRRFHEGLFDRPLAELPVLTKQTLMANWDEVVTDPSLKVSEVRAFIEDLDTPQLFHDRYVLSTTSGSTGLKGVFAFDRQEWLWGCSSHARATSWAGAEIGPFHRKRLALVSSTKPWCKSLLVAASTDTPVLPTLRLDSTEPMHRIVDQLNAFQPEILIAYAETIHALALRQMSGQLAIQPQMVCASSEVFTAQARDRVRRAWGAEPFNAYAATETALIAADCDHHQMHLAEDLVIAEAVDRDNRPVPPGVYGDKLLVTVLFDRTVPLIRYELSDQVALADAGAMCACGKPFAVLAGIRGRVEDTMRMPGAEGEAVAIKPDVFHDVMEPAPIDGWQVTQESQDSLTLSIVGPQSGYDEQVIAEALRKRLVEQGAIAPHVRIQIVDQLQQSATGKTRLVRALASAPPR